MSKKKKSCHNCIKYDACKFYDFLRKKSLQGFFKNGMISYFAEICDCYYLEED